MFRIFSIILLAFMVNQVGFTQEVSGTHNVQPGDEPNEYHIKTTVKGLEGVDIARIKYIIDNTHTYKASPNNALFSDRNEKYIKFYVMAVPATGILDVELGLVLSGDGDFSFPVEFQFSRNEEKEVVNLPLIKIGGVGALVAEETSDTPPPVAEEIPEPTPVSEVEADPIVEETTESTPEAEVETDVVVEEIPEPTPVPEVEADLIVEETTESTPEAEVETDVVVEEIPEPTPVPEVEADPIVEETTESAPEAEVETDVVVEEIPEPTPVPEVEADPIVEETVEPTPEEVVEIDPVEETTPVSSESSRVSVKYTVQLLSLSKFSPTRLATYCRQHNLSVDEVKKNQVGPWMKITYGEASSIQEANEIRDRLKRDNNIQESFVTIIK